MLRQESLLYILTAVVFFGIGTRFSAIHDGMRSKDTRDKKRSNLPPLVNESSTMNSKKLELANQRRSQQHFHAWVQHQQEHPTDCSRVLRYYMSNDEQETNGDWIESLERLAGALKVALATERRLVVSLDKQLSSLCRRNKNQFYYCRWRERDGDKCVSRSIGEAFSISPALEGILSDVNNSDFFQVHLYGPSQEVNLPRWPWKKSWLLDVLEWDRYWGAFWTRSQLLHFLLFDVAEAVVHSNSINLAIVLDEKGQTMAMEQFGRNGTKSHDWDRLWTGTSFVKNQLIVGENLQPEPFLPTMFVVVSPSFGIQSWGPPTGLLANDWNVTEVKTGDLSDMNTLNVLREAKFLIGSFASPLFRLATALNTVYQIGNYSLSERRHWGIDVEWVEHG